MLLWESGGGNVVGNIGKVGKWYNNDKGTEYNLWIRNGIEHNWNRDLIKKEWGY